MKKLLLAAAFATTNVAAADLNLSVFGSDEGDGSSSDKTAVTYRTGDLGIRVQNTRWAGLDPINGNGFGVDIQKYWSAGSLEGHLVWGEAGLRKWVDADINAAYTINRELSAGINLVSDTLSSYNLQPGIIKFVGAGFNVDWTNGVWGGNIQLNRQNRTDGTQKNGAQIKAWTTVYPGITVQLTHKEYSNTQTSPLYFSPLNYGRTGVGANWRLPVGKGHVKVSVENSRVSSDGFVDRAVLGKIEVEQRLTNNIKLQVLAGRDYSLNGYYVYNFKQIVFKTSF